MIRDVTDLVIYKNALEFLPLIYDLASQVPDRHRKLRGQLIESAEAIAALIAEGYGKKRSEKEFKRFLEMALGSSDETVTHARMVQIVALRIKIIDQKLCEQIIECYKKESRQIQQLIKTWQSYTS